MGEEQIIWVVTEGEYSDYAIVGTFSTKENAEACIAVLGDCTRVEEWILDAYIPDFRQGLRPWMIWILRDGTVRNANETSDLPEPDAFYPTNQLAEKRDLMQVCVFARDREHAIKIANERRAIHLADGTWGVSPHREGEDEG